MAVKKDAIIVISLSRAPYGEDGILYQKLYE